MKLKQRRLIAAIFSLVILCIVVISQAPHDSVQTTEPAAVSESSDAEKAVNVLEKLVIKGRSPLTGYSRDQFGNGWKTVAGCDTRNVILNRDLDEPIVNSTCQVISGLLHDPYTGKDIMFQRGSDTSADVQIDHVVALADAWQSGAWQFSESKRIALANDPLELLAVDSRANQQKSGSNAASWLPSNKSFRCQYVARQIAVKVKYGLWVTQPEHDSMQRILTACPNEPLPSP